MKKRIAIIGIASGWGAPDQRTANGAHVVIHHLKQHYPDLFYTYASYHLPVPLPSTATKPLQDHAIRQFHVTRVVTELSHHIETLVSLGYFPIVIGGDHSIAIGTWSGIKRAYNTDFSLLWFDAHMDAHTYETTTSLSPHGMPVAALLGQGIKAWTDLACKDSPVMAAEHLYQFGIRSFEAGEASLLAKNNVSIYDTKTCMRTELKPILQSVMQNLRTEKFGISIDIDAFDPIFAPGTGTTEPNGLNPNDIVSFLTEIKDSPHYVALELMEFNPDKDIDDKTLHWIIKFIETLI